MEPKWEGSLGKCLKDRNIVSAFRESLKQCLSARVGLTTLLKIPFDGDMLNLILIPDNWMREKTSRLGPHLWVLSLHKPHEISGNLTLQGPVIDTAINFTLKTQPAVA